MAKIHKFGLANSLLDSPMATWLTLTGTTSQKRARCINIRKEKKREARYSVDRGRMRVGET